jgi:hypothetical protein
MLQLGVRAMSEYSEELGPVQRSNPALATEIANFRTLEHILDWMKQNGHAFADLDMVTQDEFCHDLLMPIGSDWLVFGMT